MAQAEAQANMQQVVQAVKRAATEQTEQVGAMAQAVARVLVVV
jgi:hypothetical protein